jgi:DNA-binding PadR family transcriptional regulator
MKLTESDLYVLKETAIHEKPIYSNLLKSLKPKVGSNKTLLYSLNKLRFVGFIKSEKVPNRNGFLGRRATLFTPTILGLYVVLLWTEDRVEERPSLDEIADHNKLTLPLIFGKWKFFEDEGVKNIALELLKNAIYEALPVFWPIIQNRIAEYLRFKKKELGKMILLSPDQRKRRLAMMLKIIEYAEGKAKREIEDFFKACETFDTATDGFLTEKLYQKFFFPTRQTPQGYTDFLAACRKDKELSQYILKLLEEMENFHTNILASIQTVKESFKKG